jgi:hypothetical protein
MESSSPAFTSSASSSASESADTSRPSPSSSASTRPWSPFADPDLDREWRIGCVRRLVEDARRMQRSGCWLSVEEIEAMLSIIPRVTWGPTPRQRGAGSA